MRITLQRLWQTLLRSSVRPAAVEDVGPVDAIVRLLKTERVVESRARGGQRTGRAPKG